MMMNNILFPYRCLLLGVGLFLWSSSIVIGQADYKGLTIFSPEYYSWHTEKGSVSIYGADNYVVPGDFAISVFQRGGDDPESAAKLYWSATVREEYDAILANPDSLLKLPDLAGKKRLEDHNLKYQLINKLTVFSSRKEYCYLHYNLLTDVTPDGVEGVLVLVRKNKQWFYHYGDPVSGLGLSLMFVRPEQLVKLVKGDFADDERFASLYDSGEENAAFNLTKFTVQYKNWFSEDGAIMEDFSDILKYPNWKK